jgi:translation initiation factor 2B subunit (eIF-2B alpha/beta/delta family)
LIHGRSRTVLAMLKEANKLNKHFDVYVTETSADKSG